MTGPQDPAAAGGDGLHAGHADRKQVIEALKDAFAHGRLTREEFDARTEQALAAFADLDAVTADILGAPRPDEPPASPAPAGAAAFPQAAAAPAAARRPDRSSPGRPRSSGRDARTQRGIRSAPDAV